LPLADVAPPSSTAGDVSPAVDDAPVVRLLHTVTAMQHGMVRGLDAQRQLAAEIEVRSSRMQSALTQSATQVQQSASIADGLRQALAAEVAQVAGDFRCELAAAVALIDHKAAQALGVIEETSDIAKMVNLLALNAAIETARAGAGFCRGGR
jgi:methyl-accepting chemotaxis protein